MQPVSSAGASFAAVSEKGTFQGTIAPTTPTGCWRISTCERSPSRISTHG